MEAENGGANTPGGQVAAIAHTAKEEEEPAPEAISAVEALQGLFE